MQNNSMKLIMNENPFPWAAFSWAAKEYGALLTKKALAHILGVGIKEADYIISTSKATPVIMSNGKSFRYKFSEIPLIINAFETAQKEKLSKNI